MRFCRWRRCWAHTRAWALSYAVSVKAAPLVHQYMHNTHAQKRIVLKEPHLRVLLRFAGGARTACLEDRRDFGPPLIKVFVELNIQELA